MAEQKVWGRLVKDSFTLKAWASSDKAGHSEQGNTETGNGEERTSELWEGKGSKFSQGDKTQRHLPRSLATAWNGFTERPGFSNILCLHEDICAAICLPVECPAICRVQQLYQELEKEREREKEILYYISAQSPPLCFLNSLEEKHTARGNLVKSILPFVSCSYKNEGAFLL